MFPVQTLPLLHLSSSLTSTTTLTFNHLTSHFFFTYIILFFPPSDNLPPFIPLDRHPSSKGHQKRGGYWSIKTRPTIRPGAREMKEAPRKTPCDSFSSPVLLVKARRSD
ncbi:hypothetical protein E2C01_093678 [Portunus trituberculatus]|uniref:Uncharacterized protein n=1 Tax=Portunus trituberculatus TaxID=210409 RepID=A0A5B7JV29_PORTR|nr:hypothetical protein [Portunus trituberculatus]